MSRLTLTLLSAALLGTTARAQQTPPPPDARRLATARTVLEASGAVEAMIAGIRANLPAQRQAMPQVPTEFWTRFEERVIKDAPQLVDSIAVVYAGVFTQAELDALLAFFRSPTGTRYRALQPTLLAETTAIGQRWGQRIGSEVGASLQSR